ncbi:Secreted RxLR effector peptide protein [Phytophthora palmivora]|uniref:RxLR effector protein n=1 Tax=Phytophthora palmivora TaxID=4796 RepID=A0A2P4YHZ3_9STRA|nr:Secreted RxLR effector peptide protein [Phytophthora palmivora]
MRGPYILVAAVLTLSVHQVPVTASVGSDVALTGVMSLGFLHLVSAHQSASDQSRFLRGNNIAKGDNEERGFADVVEKLMAKNLVDKMVRTQSFSALEKVDSQAKLDKLSAAADDYLTSVFKFVHEKAKMKPEDLAIQMKTFPDVDDAFVEKAVHMYTTYLKSIGEV